jgi:hypothetical protein
MKETLENQQQINPSEKKNWVMPELSVIGKSTVQGGPAPLSYEAGGKYHLS